MLSLRMIIADLKYIMCRLWRQRQGMQACRVPLWCCCDPWYPRRKPCGMSWATWRLSWMVACPPSVPHFVGPPALALPHRSPASEYHCRARLVMATLELRGLGEGQQSVESVARALGRERARLGALLGQRRSCGSSQWHQSTSRELRVR